MKDPSPNYETLSLSFSAAAAIVTLVALPSAKTSFPASGALELSELVLHPLSYLGVVCSLVLIFYLICTYQTIYLRYQTISDLAAI